MLDIMLIFSFILCMSLFFSGVFSFVFIVKQQSAIVIERLGKFHIIRHAGLHFKLPIIDNIVGKLSLKIQQLDVVVETKTKDNVFVRIKVSVQFQVIEDKVYDAFYKLDNSNAQIRSYIFDVVRAEVPKMRLDDVFERKDNIALAVRGELKEAMENYGYNIIKALVTDIDPDEQVKHAMNKINTAEREKVAAEYEAEAERIKIVAKAKAEAESKKLQGQGIADQRREIAKGLLESVEVLNNAGINSHEASSLILVTQHYDTLHSIGSHTGSNLILLPNSPSSANDLLNSMLVSLTASNKMIKNTNDNNQNIINNTKIKK
jgi:regulator of protease activity HflC (stomatin/prohibitin superfamily)